MAARKYYVLYGKYALIVEGAKTQANVPIGDFKTYNVKIMDDN